MYVNAIEKQSFAMLQLLLIFTLPCAASFTLACFYIVGHGRFARVGNWYR